MAISLVIFSVFNNNKTDNDLSIIKIIKLIYIF